MIDNIKSKVKLSEYRNVIITIIFILMLVILVTRYGLTFRSLGEAETKTELSNVTRDYADSINNDLKEVSLQADRVAYFISQADLGTDQGDVLNLYIDALNTSQNIDDAYIINESGVAYGKDGVSDEISNLLNIAEIKEDAELTYVAVTNSENISYIYEIIPCTDINGVKYFLASGYNLANLGNKVKKSSFDTTALYLLVRDNGDILFDNSKIASYSSTKNIWDDFTDNGNNIKRLQNAIRTGSEGYSLVDVVGDKRVIISCPVADKKFSAIIAVNNAYADSRTVKNSEKSQSMVKILCILLGVFTCFYAIGEIRERLSNTQSKKSLEEKADTDLLTGLNNKLATERKIKEYIEANPTASGMMILIDVDDFKKINDTKGHAFGDEVLRSLGDQMGGLFRYTDIVGRIGGDEFMVFLKYIEGDDIIRKEAVKIVNFFNDFVAGTDYIKYSATASIGVAMYPSEGANFEALYHSADKALYKSKNNGKNQLNFYNEEWDTVKA